jgi:hypothetical protein
MSDKDMLPEDSEMGIFDLWRIVRSGWRFIALGTTLGLIGGMLAIWTSPSMFQATAIIQPGLVGGDGDLPTRVKALNVKGTNMIELKTWAENPDSAKRLNEVC